MSSLVRLGYFALLALAVSCGSASTQPAPAPAAGAAAATVTYQSFAVSPASVEVKAGEAVSWTNKDGTTHTVTAGKPGAKSGAFQQTVSGNASASVTFDKAGTFDYFCEFHSSMVGKVVVR